MTTKCTRSPQNMSLNYHRYAKIFHLKAFLNIPNGDFSVGNAIWQPCSEVVNSQSECRCLDPLKFKWDQSFIYKEPRSQSDDVVTTYLHK